MLKLPKIIKLPNKFAPKPLKQTSSRNLVSH